MNEPGLLPAATTLLTAIVPRVSEPEDDPLEGSVDEEETEGHAVPRLSRAGAAIRGLAIDVTPLRVSRDYRLLWSGELISTTGRQITLVALPYQVFKLTGSSLAVGIAYEAEVFRREVLKRG